jgi:hypothetical protein
MLRRIGIISVLSLIVAAVAAVPAIAASPHEKPRDPIECTLSGANLTRVTCGGTVAGLGNVSQIIATVEADFACETRSGSNQPGGHVQGDTDPINVRNGSVTFSVDSGPARCPRGLNPVVGDTALVTIEDLQGNVLFQKEVPITS